jgi:glycosyltransferase involved in cell wall biosynthesis
MLEGRLLHAAAQRGRAAESKMKVAFLQPWDSCAPPNPGGSLGVWTWEVARRMAKSCDVSIYTARAKSQPANEELDGVRFSRFSTGIDRRVLGGFQRALRRRGGEPIEFAPSYYCLYVMRAARAALADRCDVVHIFNLSQFVPLMKRMNPRAKVILNMQCDWAAQLDRDFIKRGIGKADAILGCSQDVTNKIRRRFPEYADRCVTVYNGADPHEFSPTEGDIPKPFGSRIIYVGRLSPEKGVHVLLDGFKRVIERHPGARLEIVGGESVMPRALLRTLSDDPGVTALSRFYGCGYGNYLREQVTGSMKGRVSFTGALAHPEIAARVRRADILVQASLYEPFGIPVVEGMSAGLAVVASRVGGMIELIQHEKTGLLVNPDDPEALAHALLRLLNDPELARRLGLAARADASRRFSWDSSVDSLIRCCRAIREGQSLALHNSQTNMP